MPTATRSSYAWDFTDDGTVDATTANASHTYEQPGEYTARFTVSDGERSRSVLIDIDVYPPVASCPGNDEFEGTSLDTSRWSVVRRDDQFLSVEGGIAEPQRPAGRGHPRRGDGPAQHRAPGPAGLRPLDRDRARDLEPDRQLPERRPRDLHGRRELDQERDGVGQRARVRGVQGAQQHAVRPRLGGRRRLVPEHVLRALHERRHDGARAALGRRPDVDQHRQRDQPQRAHQPEGRHVRHRVHRRRHAGQHGALRLLHARRAAGPERRVRRHVAQHVPLVADRPARAGRLHAWAAAT